MRRTLPIPARRLLLAFAFAAALALPRPAAFALCPDTVVVVNKRSSDSRALGRYYAQKRGIPERNVCTISVDPKSPHITQQDFESSVRDVIDAFLANEGLRDHVRFLVLSMDIPTRVAGDNSITGALFYGVKSRTPGVKGCEIAAGSAQPYYGLERRYLPMTWPGQPEPRPLPFMLAVPTLDAGKALVDRSVAADASFPSGAFCLFGSGDTARNIRHVRYPAVRQAFDGIAALLPPGTSVLVAPTNSPVPEVPVLGCVMGLAYIPAPFSSGATLAPGAIAEHLTSCGGMLPDPCFGQSTIRDWFALGAAASYGTVAEPCAYAVKFPDPLCQFWYARGFTAGESLWMSVKNPYQGLFAGDPLCAPFARGPPPQHPAPPPPPGRLPLAPGRPLKLRLSAAAPGDPPPVWLDLYVDGRHHAAVARPIAPVLNRISVAVGPSNAFSYTVAPGESLVEAVAGLAWAVNRHGFGRFKAAASGDRLEIAVTSPLGDDGKPLAFSVSARKGAAEALYIGAVPGRAGLSVGEDGIGRAAALFHLGTVPSYEIEYTPSFSASIPPGDHVLSFVARDGSARQVPSSLDIPVRILE